MEWYKAKPSGKFGGKSPQRFCRLCFDNPRSKFVISQKDHGFDICDHRFAAAKRWIDVHSDPARGSMR